MVEELRTGVDVKDVRRIIGALRKKPTVRLADLSGISFFLKNHGLNEKEEPLPFEFPVLDYRLRQLFKTAKYLEASGVCKVIFKRGENYVVRGERFD